MVEAAELEVWNHRFAEVAEEMGAVLRRAALSPNIKERRDLSCAICDGKGDLVAVAAHIPVHLGAAALSVRAAIERVALSDGAVAIVNDPFAGGTHLPDVTLVAAVDLDGERFYLANRAHHADVGGAAPGSMPAGLRGGPGELPEAEPDVIAVGPRYRNASLPRAGVTIDDEGTRIAPALLTDAVAEEFAQKSRTPDERRGDLAAQRASLEIGRRRMKELATRHGARVVAERAQALKGYSARIMRAAIAAIPGGTYAFADGLDDDGAGRDDVAIRVSLTVDGERAIVDFSDSDPESAGSLNAVAAVTISSVLYCFRLLCPDDTPTNEGILAPIEVVLAPGTIVSANPPRAVAAGNVETSQRIVDVVLGALAQALPARIPAASSGSMSNLMFGGTSDGKPFAYYETIAGGSGAGPNSLGARAIHTHMTNTWNTPVEALEHALPVRVRRYAVRRGSGGFGARNGGDGVEREIEFLAPATVTLIGERRRRFPYGLDGGGPGSPGEDRIVRGGREVRLPSKVTFEAEAGDRLTICTPGGGAHGKPPRPTSA
jgi:N-methylhydantoinase B